MGKWALLGTVVLVVLLAVYRERIFVRDPLARVERNGQQQEGLRVFLNYSNDVLVQSGDFSTTYMVQGWNKLPGVPSHLWCIQLLMCVTEADHAPTAPLLDVKHEHKVEMTTKMVSYRDDDGALVQVMLR